MICAHYFQRFTGYLNHVDLLMLDVATCFEETTQLFSIYFVDFILFPTDKYLFKVKKIRIICWTCLKLRINTAWHSSGVFIVDFNHSQHIRIVFLLLTFKIYLKLGCERQVIMFWKYKKLYICFVIKVTRSISFSDLSFAPNWNKLWTNDHIMNILWT